jgi:hypothetical protein
MNNQPWWKAFFSWRVLLPGFLIAAALTGMFIMAAWLMHNPASASTASVEPDVTLIPAPTLTLVIVPPTPAVTPTVDLSATPIPPPANGAITKRMYVQISGTGGSGLRLRASPGVNSTPLFLGMDAEAFQVTDGPKTADGFTWFYLVAPYDKQRAGWAVSNYLTIIQQPQSTP